MQRFHRLWIVALVLAGCSAERLPDGGAPNQPPTVWVQAEPPIAADESFSIQFAWGGVDPDGDVSHYEFLVVDNGDGGFDPATVTGDWTSVFGTDSTIAFSLPKPAEGEESPATPSYTFLIRAVDNEMLPSTEPDYIAFTPISLIPSVLVVIPNASLGLTPAAVPPISTFQWVSSYPEPDSVQVAMVNTAAHNNSYAETVSYLRDFAASASEWYPWVWFDTPENKGRQWTTPPLDLGQYVFAVRAKSVVAINPVLREPFNVRRIRVVPPGSTAPTLVVRSNMQFGYIVGNSCDYPLTIVDMAAHLPISFTFSACADNYGGTVVGYRFGWDILDPDDPDQWEMDYTPFERPSVSTRGGTFSFGTHVFTVEVIDNLGSCSRVQVKVNMVPFTGERNLLVVDDYRADEVPGQSGWDATNGAIPSDAEHDAFWLDMVSDVDQFDPAVDMVNTAGQAIPIATMARYRSIVWNAYSDVDIRIASDLPYLYTFIRYRANLLPPNVSGACSPTGGVSGQVITNAISLAMQSGVHVLISGNHPVQNIVPRTGNFSVRWPMIPLYELEPGAVQTGTFPTYLEERPGRVSFAYQDLCLQAIDYGYLTNQRARVRGAVGAPAQQRYCPINDWRSRDANSRRDDTMRSGLPLDANFPTISLRPEAAGPGRFYSEGNQGYDVEVYNPAYFRQGAACAFVEPPSSCFEPIYGLVCLDTAELTYQQPVAFWTGAYANVIAQDIPGAIAARSAVFGFPPVYFNPGEIKPAIEHILFDEWQLPRAPARVGSR